MTNMIRVLGSNLNEFEGWYADENYETILSFMITLQLYIEGYYQGNQNNTIHLWKWKTARWIIMAKIHNGFINDKLKNTFKDSGLNNFDLATTKVYKGVKPMWEQLGFQNDDSDNPNDDSYWKKIIPSDFNFFNYSNIQVETVEKDNQIGVSTAKKLQESPMCK